jgi:hypothetical protein
MTGHGFAHGEGHEPVHDPPMQLRVPLPCPPGACTQRVADA